MAKFDKKAGSGDSGRRGARGDKKTIGRGKGAGDAESKSYKAKRSFTKNKDFRDKKDSDKPRRSFGSDDKKPFKRDYDKGGSFRDKPVRDDREKSGEREERKPFNRDSDRGSFRDKGERSERPRTGDRDDRKPFKRDFDKPGRSFGERSEGGERKRSAGGEERKPFKRSFDNDRPERARPDREEKPRSYDRDEKKPYKSRSDDRDSKFGDRPERPSFRENKSDRPERAPREEREPAFEKPRKPSESTGKTGGKEDSFERFKKNVRKSHGADKDDKGAEAPKRRLTKPRRHEDAEGTRRVKFDEFEEGKVFSNKGERSTEKKEPKKAPVKKQTGDGLIRLNKYLSNAGIASRREADNLIQSGTVKVNGVVVDQLGYKINPNDKVTYGDASVKSERKVYLLLNKPKDYITTVDDPRERKTVMELIKGACRERVYPVGRLDRNTTGLLLFTNDGELTTKLTHPKFGVKKVYHVSLSKGLKPADFTAIIEGVELEDGIVKADDLAFVGEGKKEIGIEIHSGRNRIVRRLFEHLGYEVLKLDRVVFAGLTKKDLPRGKHRFLTAKEISFLQMIG